MNFIDAVTMALTVLVLSVTFGAVFTYIINLLISMFSQRENGNGKN